MVADWTKLIDCDGSLMSNVFAASAWDGRFVTNVRSGRGALVVAAALVVSGCGLGQPKRLAAPALDSASVTRSIMEVADANGDGLLSIEELGHVPGLKTIAGSLDQDKDGTLRAAEIENWLAGIKASRVAIGPGSFTVTRGGEPLANVTVTLIPDPVMGEGMSAAEGVTDDQGRVNPSIPGSLRRGVNYGLYRVQLTGRGADGESLPPKYNTATELGIAIGGDVPGDVTLVLSLD